MKKYLIILCTIFLSGLSHGAETEVELLKKLPEALSEFRSGQIESYDDERYGASVRFQVDEGKKHTTVSIILFDAGLGPISDGLSSDITYSAHKAAIRDIEIYERKGYYKDVKKLEDNKLNIGKVELLHANYVYATQRGPGVYTPVKSWLLMTGIKGYMLKIRITGNTSNLDQAFVVSLTDRVLKALIAGQD